MSQVLPQRSAHPKRSFNKSIGEEICWIDRFVEVKEGAHDLDRFLDAGGIDLAHRTVLDSRELFDQAGLALDHLERKLLLLLFHDTGKFLWICERLFHALDCCPDQSPHR